MTQDKNTRKIIFLAVIAVIVAVFAMVFSFSLFNSDDEPDAGLGQQVTTFPANQNDVQLPVSEIEDEFVKEVTPTDIISTGADNNLNSVSDDSSAGIFSSDSWKDESVSYDNPSEYVPVTGVTEAPAVSYNFEDILAEDQAYQEALKLYEEIKNSIPPAPPSVNETLSQKNSSYTSCGSINFPSFDNGYEDFLSDLDESSAIKCMGEAVANGCQSVQVNINKAGSNYTEHITLSDDGMCTIATSYDGKHGNFCKFYPYMNFTTGKNRSESSWLTMFEEEPAETFSLLHNSFSASSGGPSDDLDCTVKFI